MTLVTKSPLKIDGTLGIKVGGVKLGLGEDQGIKNGSLIDYGK